MDDTTREMRDLLIRLDEKVASGFTSINQKLDSMERRADLHDERIKSIEMEISSRRDLVDRLSAVEGEVGQHSDHLLKIDTTSANIKTMLVAAWAVFGTAVLAVGAKLVGLF